MILDQRVIGQGEDELVPTQDLKKGLHRPGPQSSVGPVEHRQEFRHRQFPNGPLMLEGETQGGEELGEETPECPPAGVVLFIDDLFLRLAHFVRSVPPSVGEVMAVACQDRVGDQPRRRRLIQLEPL